MSGARFFVTGGCVYRMAGDERRLGSICEMAVRAARRGDHIAWAGHHAIHTSNLPQGRCLWLREQINDPRLTWAISVDGDTTFEAQDLLLELPRVIGDAAIGIAPVRVGGTEDLCNLCLSDGDESSHGARIGWGDELRAVLRGSGDIASGGFGVAVFNLDWFRRQWAAPVPERVAIDTGEDIEFCRSVRARGGRIIALRVKTDHFAWGERQTR